MSNKPKEEWARWAEERDDLRLEIEHLNERLKDQEKYAFIEACFLASTKGTRVSWSVETMSVWLEESLPHWRRKFSDGMVTYERDDHGSAALAGGVNLGPALELIRDKRRMDWLQEKFGSNFFLSHGGNNYTGGARDAIDLAIHDFPDPS